jgi:hypothetical protein
MLGGMSDTQHVHEVRQGRDGTLPTPRALCPGERMVEGRVLYSAAWLNAPDGDPAVRDIELGGGRGKQAAEPRPLPGYDLHVGLDGSRVTSIVFTAKDQAGIDEILPAILEIARRLDSPSDSKSLASKDLRSDAPVDEVESLDGRGASDADLRLRARARAAREVIRDNPDVDRLAVLSLAL